MNATAFRDSWRWDWLVILVNMVWQVHGGEPPPPPVRLTSVKTLDVDGKLQSPSFILLSQDGRFAYVASWANATIGVFTRDPQSSEPKLVTTITDNEQLAGCTRFALHPRGHMLAVTSFRANTVTLFDIAHSGRLHVVDRIKSGAADAELLSGIKACVWSPDGRYLYVGDGQYSIVSGEMIGRVIVYEFIDDQKLQRVQLLVGENKNLANLTDLSCHPDGHTMFATSAGAGTLVVFDRDPDSGKIAFRQVLRNAGPIRGLDGVIKHRLSPDHQFLYTISGRWNGDQCVCVFRFSSKGQLHVVQQILAGQDGMPNFQGGHSIAFSHDGLYLYASFAESSHLLGFARNPLTGQLTLIETLTDSSPIAVPRGIAGLAVTPDDKYLYVASEYGRAVSILSRGIPKMQAANEVSSIPARDQAIGERRLATPIDGQAEKKQSPKITFYTVDHYDETRNPAADLAAAAKRAQAEKKHILVQVGGDWCGWCKRMSSFMESTESVRDRITNSYVVMKVTYTHMQKNEAFLSKYPRIKGYPHLFVFDQDGKLLHSQDTAALEEDISYNERAFLDFLDKWKPNPSDK